MDLTDLHVFRTVVESGGITAAANRLHRVQSNVTARIQKLEEDLGTQLFVRVGKRLQITPAGRTLLDYAHRLLVLADEARNAVQTDAPPRGLLTLGTMESTAGVRLPGPLAEYHRRYAEVRVELHTGSPRELMAKVLAGESDAALVAEPVSDARLSSLAVFDEELVLVTVADHPVVRKPADLREASVLAFHPGCPHRERLERWFGQGGREIARTVELASYHVMLGCVAAGMGAALMPRSVLDGYAARSKLREHKLPAPFQRAKTLLVWRKDQPQAKVSALAEILTKRKRVA
ncbi:LysR family transcriptional regulator [Ferrovibrio terrae]|uniref:LysR family transcriptional regulator n=1 Tax=Ferrovibrio terrae TaxID=2594003 RepID=A0A516H6D1_9PROT|nr:LysR family transcriptional regulator [Ferrovibrio terrae]QDO99329.1 LysR family transcriptional regulator [Ferrovibrio terrae]